MAFDAFWIVRTTIAAAFVSALAPGPLSAAPTPPSESGETPPSSRAAPDLLDGPCFKGFAQSYGTGVDYGHQYKCTSNQVGTTRGAFASAGTFGCTGKFRVSNVSAKVDGNAFVYRCVNKTDISPPLPNLEGSGPCSYPAFGATKDNYANAYECRLLWTKGCPTGTVVSPNSGKFVSAIRRFEYWCKF
jgi:hypothetical protein